MAGRVETVSGGRGDKYKSVRERERKRERKQTQEESTVTDRMCQ